MGKSVFWGGASLLVTLATAAMAEVTLEAPTQVPAGASFEVRWSGETDPADLVALVPPESPEGQHDTYKYARSPSATFVAPDDPGAYELRYVSKDSVAPLARRALEVTPVTATLSGPETVEAGGTIELTWAGPGNDRDFITVVAAGAEERTYGSTYAHLDGGSPTEIVAPEAPGEYEARYLTGQKYYTLARHSFRVTAESPAP